MTGARERALDPDVQRVLDLLNGDGSRRLADQSPVEARRRLAELPLPGPREEPLARVQDRAVPVAGGGTVPVRVYAAVAADELPVLVHLHGGGWVTGDLEVGDYRCRRLARRIGCLVVAVEYRLAPEHPFPAALEDACAVLEWAAAESSSVGGDPARVAVAGDSSGGNLAAGATLALRDRGGPSPVFQVLTCPVLDHEFESESMRAYGEGFVLDREDLRWCWGHYLADRAHASSPYAAPLRAERLDGLPPALVVTAELDPLRDQGERYARRLAAAGVETTLTRYPGMIHSFVDFEGSVGAAADAVAESARALWNAWGVERSPAESPQQDGTRDG